MGPRTFRSTSKKTDRFITLETNTEACAWKHGFICCDDALLLLRWFEGFNWDGLCKCTLNPPVIPTVRHIQFDVLLFCFAMTLFAVSRSPLSMLELFIYLFMYFVFQVKHLLDTSTCDHYTEGSVELSTNWDDF